MKTIYAGPLEAGGSCSARLRVLRDLSEDVTVVDTQRLDRLSGFQKMLLNHSLVKELNQELKSSCLRNSPSLAWIDKGYWILPETLRALRSMGIFLVQHNTDALRTRNWKYNLVYRLMRKTLRLYDIYLTSNVPDFEALSPCVPPQVYLTHLGYDHCRFDSRPVPDAARRQWESDLLFVGHHEPRTEAGIAALIEAGLKVKVYGAGWEKAKNRNRLNGFVQFRSLSNQEYFFALRSAKVALCFVSEWNDNQTAGRSFEIPACGTFLLAMRTDQHLASYQEGKEAEFFGDHEELVRKAEYYLAHEDERLKIAQKGYERCMRSGYSWADIMKRDWQKVVQCFEARKKTAFAGNYASVKDLEQNTKVIVR